MTSYASDRPLDILLSRLVFEGCNISARKPVCPASHVAERRVEFFYEPTGNEFYDVLTRPDGSKEDLLQLAKAAGIWTQFMFRNETFEAVLQQVVDTVAFAI
jgi:hypothetical protein